MDFPCVACSRRVSGGRAGLAIDGLSHQIGLIFILFICTACPYVATG